ncbi:MAG: hypothetical protein ACFBRM_07505 [Pikeienuella sp.]
MIGTGQKTRSNQAWRQVYRGLEHGRAKDCCKNKKMMSRFPKEIQDVAYQFKNLQEKRHSADYDPLVRFSRSSVLDDIEIAEEMIRQHRAVAIPHRRAFAAFLLLGNPRS